MSVTKDSFKASDLTIPQDIMSVIRMENMPVTSSGNNSTSDFSSMQLINLPVFSDGTIAGVDPQQSYIIATSSDGNTILVEASQLAMLSEQTIPLYDGTNIFQLTSQSASESVEATDNIEDVREEPTISIDQEKNTDKSALIDDEIQPPDKKGSYKCHVCKEEFPNNKHLQRHYKIHADDKPHRCDECNASFNNISNLHLHKATHSTSDLKCPECDRSFTRLASLKSHLMLHETEENLICTECGDEFVTQFQLDKHMAYHMKELIVDKSFVCRYCSKGFQKLTYLKDHMKMHYKIRASLNHRQYRKINDRSKFPHKCYFCGKQFQKPSQLIRHNRIHTGERPFKCDVCSRAFNQKGALLIHQVKHTGERPFICEFCPAAFAQKGNLRNHIRRVHTLLPLETTDGVHKCELCSCVFRKLGSLNAHMSRAHSTPSVTFIEVTKNQDNNAATSEMSNVVQQLIELSKEAKSNEINKENIEKIVVDGSVSADILQQALENSGLVSTEPPDKSKPYIMTVEDTATGTMRKHIMRNIGGVRWYQCVYCSKEFKKPSDLVRHIRIHTHERPFKCDQCYRAFAVKSTLSAHIRTHSGTKDFSCQHCKKLFSTSGSLKVHLLLHSGLKPFSCTLCDKSFRTSGHRNSHMATHQKEKIVKRSKKSPKMPTINDIPLTDIPMQEPILITDEGLVQPVSKNSAIYNELIKAKFSNDRPYRCTICEKAFKKSSHLKQHIRSHTGEKPFICGLCQRAFVSNGVLKAHMRIHTGMRAYQCTICDGSFTTNGSLKRHMSIHSNERPYMCPYCQKTFKTAMNCKKHMHIHRYELALGLAAGVSVTVMSDGVAGAQNPQEETDKDISSTPEQQKITANGETDLVAGSNTGGEGEPILCDQNGFITNEQEILPQQLTQEVFISETGMIEHIEVVSQPEVFGQTPNIFAISETEFDQTQLTLQADPVPEEFVSSTTTNDNHEQVQLTLSDLLEQEKSVAETNQVTNAENNTSSDKQKVVKKRKYKAPFKCEQCFRVFRKTSHLKQHLLSHTGEKNFYCTICGDFFSHNRVLKHHIKTKHEGVKEFKCTICNTSFTSNYNVIRHMATHDTGYPYHCAYCSDKFMTKECYKLHVNEHHQITETREENVTEIINPVPAAVFDGVEVQINDIAEKIMVDSAKSTSIDTPDETIGKSQNQANVNDFMAEKILLKSLKESRNSKSGAREYNPKQLHHCSQCSKSFKKPSDLVRHFRIHTGEKPYSCLSCGKAFTVKSTLISHQKTHTGEKNYSCHVCNSLFATKGSLKIHMRLHTGSRPFKCPHCELQFRTSGHRKSHMASHFKDRINRKRKILPAIDMEAVPATSTANSTIVSIGEEVVFSSEVCAELPTFSADSFQLPASIFNPNVQLTTIDPNTCLTKPFQIDASVLQQLQTLNFNIALNPNEPQVINSKTPMESNQTQQIISIEGNTPISNSNNNTFTINPNMIIQGLGFTIASQQQSEVQNSDNLTLIIPGTSLLKNSTIHGGELLESQVLAVADNTKENSEFIDVSKSQEIYFNATNITNLTEISPATNSVIETVHVCSVCKKGFKTLRQLKNHSKTHKKPENIYHCEICDTSFKLQNQLLKHMLNVHQKAKNSN